MGDGGYICPLHSDHNLKWDDFDNHILKCTKCGAKMKLLEKGN